MRIIHEIKRKENHQNPNGNDLDGSIRCCLKNNYPTYKFNFKKTKRELSLQQHPIACLENKIATLNQNAKGHNACSRAYPDSLWPITFQKRPTPSETYLGTPWRISLVLLKKWSINTSHLPNPFPCPWCAVEMGAAGNGWLSWCCLSGTGRVGFNSL